MIATIIAVILSIIKGLFSSIWESIFGSKEDKLKNQLEYKEKELRAQRAKNLADEIRNHYEREKEKQDTRWQRLSDEEKWDSLKQ